MQYVFGRMIYGYMQSSLVPVCDHYCYICGHYYKLSAAIIVKLSAIFVTTTLFIVTTVATIVTVEATIVADPHTIGKHDVVLVTLMETNVTLLKCHRNYRWLSKMGRVSFAPPQNVVLCLVANWWVWTVYFHYGLYNVELIVDGIDTTNMRWHPKNTLFASNRFIVWSHLLHCLSANIYFPSVLNQWIKYQDYWSTCCEIPSLNAFLPIIWLMRHDRNLGYISYNQNFIRTMIWTKCSLAR